MLRLLLLGLLSVSSALGNAPPPPRYHVSPGAGYYDLPGQGYYYGYPGYYSPSAYGLPPAAPSPGHAPSPAKPPAAKPSPAKPPAPDPSPTKPPAAKPSPAKPPVPDPSPAKPPVPDPSPAKPPAAKPSPAKPPVPDPSPAKPPAAKPSPAKPPVPDPSTAKGTPVLVSLTQSNLACPTARSCPGRSGIKALCEELRTSGLFTCLNMWSTGASGEIAGRKPDTAIGVKVRAIMIDLCGACADTIAYSTVIDLDVYVQGPRA